MENDTAIFNAVPTRILPDTCVELVVHFNDPYKTTFSNNASSIQQQSFIVSQLKSFMDIRPNGKTGFIAVRFSAWSAYRFLGIPMKEVANTETGLHYVWKGLAMEIEERIVLAQTTDLRIKTIQEYLFIQLSRNGRFDKAIDFCLAEITSAKGCISIEDLAYKTGISTR